MRMIAKSSALGADLIDADTGELRYQLIGPVNECMAVAERAQRFAGPYESTHGIGAGIDRRPRVRISWSAYPMHFNPTWQFSPDYVCGLDNFKRRA